MTRSAVEALIRPRERQEQLQKLAHGETNRASATVERLMHLGVDAATIGQDGVMRLANTPFTRMVLRCQLDPTDKERNVMLGEAGTRWQSNWYGSGLCPTRAINYDSLGGGGGDPASSMPVSERAAYHRKEFRSAYKILSEREVRCLGGVLLDERPIDDVAAEVLGSGRRSTRAAAFMDLIRSALEKLVVHYGLESRRR